MKKHIPNAITTLNLLCGCLAITNAFTGELYISSLLIFVGTIFDFMDGAAARLLKVSNPLGEQLDSLSDMVSFGLAPGIILFQYVNHLQEINPSDLITSYSWLPYLAFFIPVFSSFRLAKFNIDTRQTSSFIGLPTPANAGFFIFIVVIYFFPDFPQIIPTKNMVIPIISNPILMLGLGIVFSFLLLAEVPMFSLKMKSLKWKGNELPLTFILLFFLFLALFSLVAFPLILLLYVLWSTFAKITTK
ncbi:MAG: CDP-alcohol phosphatidyltransferase family protein [Flavobacteriales bacterium]|nr:CDP-alcohol phosphatidyltransferase family protein [Flavobacteriales bacterium]MCB9173024.1 CDP-alcohol phosphatidyltransferase family protein [Flavobacteriales bacterium]